MQSSIKKISVIVPENPFVDSDLRNAKHCLAALDVANLMEWWPGTPHVPHRNPHKVTEIQRSLDWRRVTSIAAYLLQDEILDAPAELDECFREIYEPKMLDPGREWPPKVPRVVGYERSRFPTFSNVLLHLNGAKVTPINGGAAQLIFDEEDPKLHLTVIDGQHRINGAYLAVAIRKRTAPMTKWEIPSEVFLDLDSPDEAPRNQAQIFIDVNFNQKKVDRSLVADLFPTARGPRGPLDDKERAQDIGRKLMLEIGPLVGMIQIPGIKFGVRDVVTLATLNSAVESVLEDLRSAGLRGLDQQVEFLAQCLNAWLDASGRRHDIEESPTLDPENVAYQGRVLVSAIALIPAAVWHLKKGRRRILVSDTSKEALTQWFGTVLDHAGLMKNKRFIPKSEFRDRGFLGSGGIGRFRDTLWAATIGRKISKLKPERKAALAESQRKRVREELGAG